MIAFKLFCVLLLAPTLIDARSYLTSFFGYGKSVTLCPEIEHCGPNDFGYLKPYPPDCEFYVYCDSDQTEILSRCRSGYHFSPETNNCLPIEEANCPTCVYGTEPPATTSEPTTVLTTEPTTVIPSCPETPTCDKGDYSTKPYPPDCTRYIYCDVTGQQIRKCANGNHYSPLSRACKTPEEAECPFCLVTTTPVPTTTTPVPTTTPEPTCPEIPTCLPEETGLTKAYPPDCTRYMYCGSNGTFSMRTCRTGLAFSDTEKKCVPTVEANCPFCIVTTLQPAVTCPPVPTCSIELSGYVLPYPPNCNQYIYCNDLGEAELSICPFNDHFNEELGTCIDELQSTCVNCGDEIIPTSPSIL